MANTINTYPQDRSRFFARNIGNGVFWPPRSTIEHRVVFHLRKIDKEMSKETKGNQLETSEV